MYELKVKTLYRAGHHSSRMAKKAVQRGRSKRPACAKPLSASVATPGLRSHFGGGGSAKKARRRLGSRGVLCSVRRASKRRENKAG